MVRSIATNTSQDRYCAMVSESILIQKTTDSVWSEVGDFVGLVRWVKGAQKTESLSKARRGLGAARRISFSDGSVVIEYAVGWEEGKYISYIATCGLPLDGYHATISVSPKGKSSQVVWASFLISDNHDKKKFEEFVEFIEAFYSCSLKNLKTRLEKS